MLTSKSILWMLILVVPVVFSSGGMAAQQDTPQADGTEKTVMANSEQPTPAQPGQGPAPQPGAMTNAPVTLVPGLTVDPVPMIKQRGHVNNLCEENEMMLTLVRQQGGIDTFGDYRVAYMIDRPQGWYELVNGRLVWRDPKPGETVHLETVVLDSLTNKWMPMQNLVLDVRDQQGKTVESHPLIMLWHPMADHYGWNYSIPAGTYTLYIHAPVPPMGRHDRTLGQRFTQPIEATFRNVKINPAQLPSD